jgi:hypothetical protein
MEPRYRRTIIRWYTYTKIIFTNIPRISCKEPRFRRTKNIHNNNPHLFQARDMKLKTQRTTRTATPSLIISHKPYKSKIWNNRKHKPHQHHWVISSKADTEATTPRPKTNNKIIFSYSKQSNGKLRSRTTTYCQVKIIQLFQAIWHGDKISTK